MAFLTMPSGATRTARSRRRPLSRLIALVALLIASGQTQAQTASAPALKAAFLVNFAKFTEWPAATLPAGTPLVMCVANDAKVASALEEAVAGRQVAGHDVVVRRLELDGPVRSCHLLYADTLDQKAAQRLIDAVGGAPVLTVGDLGTFACMGGVANFFVEEGRMRFAVNLDAAQRFKLRLSSRLLSLAKIVKDDPNVAQR